MSTWPCPRPDICGVKNHRAGTSTTLCQRESVKGSANTAVANAAGAPPSAASQPEVQKKPLVMDIYPPEWQKELDDLLASGESQVEGVTENELDVLKNVGDFDYMDQGIQTGRTWQWAFCDGVRDVTGVGNRSIPGIMSSLVQKDFIHTSGTGSEDTVTLRPKGVAAYMELNPQAWEYVQDYS